MTGSNQTKLRLRAWDEAIAGFSRFLLAQGKREATIETYQERLLHFARVTKLLPYEVTEQQMEDFLADQDWAHETRRARINTFRQFWGWANKKDHIAVDPTQELPSLKPEEPTPRPMPYRLYLECLVRAPQRTRLILRLAGELGMRRGEIAVAHKNDLTKNDLGWSLFVHGKGGKDRILPVPRGLAHDILEQEDPWLFPGLTMGHLTPRHVAVLAQRVLPKPWSLHPLRHMCGIRSYEISRDLLAVQKLLGHASPKTTINYVAISQRQLHRVVEQVTSSGALLSKPDKVTIDMTNLTQAQREIVSLLVQATGSETAQFVA